jgi:hypothetical protein
VSSSIPFARAETSSVAVSGSLSSNWVADFGTGTNFKTNSDLLPSIFHDTGKTPAYGIQVPANTLVEVTTWLQLVSDIADGAHSVGYVIDGAYSVTQHGPSPTAEFTPAASSVTGLADDHSAPRALTRVDHMSDTAAFVVGTIHRWYNWTTDPLDFKYGIIVKILGDLPA